MYRLLLAVTLALALAVAGILAEEQCPSQCTCFNGDELEFWCDSLRITAAPRFYVNIDCKGGVLSCDNFPELEIGDGNVLPSLSVRECSLPSNLTCILRKLHATDVQKLMLRNILTSVGSEALVGLRALKQLMFYEADAQTSLPLKAIELLPSLRQFRLCGGNLSLIPDQFMLGSSIDYLELSSDNIRELPPNAFHGLDELKTLSLWGNDIANVSGEAFRGLNKLEKLWLNSNRLRVLPELLLSHTRSLTELSLVRNNINKLYTEQFRGLEKLKMVSIENDVELKLESKVFSNLPSLSNLNLARCSIRSLPSDLLLNSSSLVNLTMAFNKLKTIPKFLFKDQSLLVNLDLSYNDIVEVNSDMFADLRNIQQLVLDKNKIQALPGQLFSGLSKLKSLSISNNGLKTISMNTFQGITSLESLKLSNNQLTLLPERKQENNSQDEYDIAQQTSPFSLLRKLRYLDLKMNNISDIFEDWRNVLIFLNTLDLSWNHFTDLMVSEVRFVSSNIQVDLSHNNITTVYFQNTYQFEDQNPKTQIINLKGNPLNCDCTNYYFLLDLQSPNKLGPEFNIGDSKCSQNGPLKDAVIAKLNLDNLVCQINCTDSCYCNIRPSSKTLEMYCNNTPSIPNPSEYGLEKNLVKFLNIPPDLTKLPDNVDYMDLSGLGLKDIPFHVIPDHMKMLDLRNNDLKEIPLMVLRRNLNLMLAGNKFVCDCWRADDVSALMMHRKYILDFENVTCSDGNFISQIDALRLCDIVNATAVGTILAFVGVMIAIAALLLYRYSLEVCVYLYARGWLLWLVPEDKLDETKTYDVFISHSHQDEDYVRDELLDKLEPEYKVCVHFRDWIVGDMIPTQISNSVEQSRRTVIVLSRHFLQSQWGMNEFHAAHTLAVKERTVRVIVILMEDCPQLDKQHEELKAYLNTNTYIKRGDPMFWSRLKYALPRRNTGGGLKGLKVVKVEKDVKLGGLNVQFNSEGQLINAAFKDSVEN